MPSSEKYLPVKRLVQRVRGSVFARSVALLSGGTIAAQFIGAGVSPVLTRLYSPEVFGAFSIFAYALTFLLGIGALRYETAITLPRDKVEALDLLKLCLLIYFGGTLLLCAGIGLSGWLPEIPALGLLGSLLWLLPVSYFGAGCYQVLSYWMLRERNYKVIAQTRVVQAAGQAILQVGAGVAGAGAWGLIIGSVYGQIAGAGRLFLETAKSLGGFSWQLDRAGLKACAATHRRFPLITMPASLIHSLSFSVFPLALGSIYGAQAAGFFALQDRILNLPLALISLSVGKVFFGEVSARWRDNPASIQALFWKTFLLLFVIGLVPFGLLALFGPLLFGWVFGTDWAHAGEYARTLALAGLARFCVGPVFKVILVTGRQGFQMTADVIACVIIFGGLFLVWKYELGVTVALWTFTVGVCVMHALLMAFAVYTLLTDEKTRKRR